MKRRTMLRMMALGVTPSVAGCAFPGRRGNNSYFEYHLNIEPSERVDDVRLFVPAPQVNGEAAFPDLSAEIMDRQEAWSVAMRDTDRGPMLEIQADELAPAAGPFGYWIDFDVEDEINTRDALEHSPTLQPKEDVQQVECDFPHPERWADRLRCYSYRSAIYGEYDSETSIAVTTDLNGYNEWFDGGWTGNQYDDTVSGTVTGDGWAVASARFREGVGNY